MLAHDLGDEAVRQCTEVGDARIGHVKHWQGRRFTDDGQMPRQMLQTLECRKQIAQAFFYRWAADEKQVNRADGKPPDPRRGG